MIGAGAWSRWLSRAPSAGDEPRWVVVDTETSGLDPQTDALLAIGGVAVDAGGVRVDDSFEVVLRNVAHVDRDNIVLHGIGREAQQNGEPAEEALRAFARWAGEAPMVGFHAEFDRTVLKAAAKRAGVDWPERPWLDLAALGAGLYPEVERKGRGSLDDWLSAFGIECAARHSAAGDALATAELLLKLRARAATQGANGHAALVRIARQQRWLGSRP
jgi:DNA polymerase-3 subunit epsilon